jgi:hypothetical protein
MDIYILVWDKLKMCGGIRLLCVTTRVHLFCNLLVNINSYLQPRFKAITHNIETNLNLKYHSDKRNIMQVAFGT